MSHRLKSPLSELTIVVPSYNRQPFALRSMRYWSETDVTLHVLDGSATAICSHEIESLPGNIHYHHAPIPLLDRIGAAAALPQTRYAALLSDDEFFLSSGLEACIAELEANNDLVSCGGRCLAFRPTDAGVNGWCDYPEQQNYALLQDDAGERMLAHMNPYTPSTIYSVTRTAVWSQALSILPKREFPVFGLAEYQMEMAFSYLGKSKIIPWLLWLRSYENPSLGGDVRHTVFSRWWKQHKSASERELFLEIQSDVLASATGRDRSIIRQQVIEASNAFAVWQSGSYHDSFTRNPYLYLALRIPFSVKQRVRILTKLWKRLRPVKSTVFPDTLFMQAAAEMNRNQGVGVNMTEVQKVARMLDDFHAARKMATD